MLQRPQPDSGAEVDRPATTQLNPWQIAWHSRLLLFMGAAVGAALGFLAYTHLPPIYQSQAQVLVWLKQPNAVTSVDARSGAVEDSLATHQELLKSTRIIEHALRDPRLTESVSLQAERESPLEVVRKQLLVSRGKSSTPNNVLQVSFRGTDAGECPIVLAAVLESYRRFLEGKYQSYSGDTVERVLRERAKLEKELARKESAYQAFLEQSPLLMKKADGSDLRRDRLTIIQTKRSTLLLRGAELRSELESIETARRQGQSRQTILALIADFAHRGEESDATRTAAPTPTMDQLTPLLLDEQKLLERYGSGHPEVQSVRKRIDIARTHLVLPALAWDKPHDDHAKGSLTDPVELHLQILRQKLEHITRGEERLNRLFTGEHEEARKQSRYEIQDDAHHNGILLTRQSYDALNKRLQDVSLVKNAGGYDVEVISPPSPSHKVSPNAYLIFPAAALLGVLAGFGLGYVREWTGKRSSSSNRERPSAAVYEDGALAGARNGLARIGSSDNLGQI